MHIAAALGNSAHGALITKMTIDKSPPPRLTPRPTATIARSTPPDGTPPHPRPQTHPRPQRPRRPPEGLPPRDKVLHMVHVQQPRQPVAENHEELRHRARVRPRPRHEHRPENHPDEVVQHQLAPAERPRDQ